MSNKKNPFFKMPFNLDIDFQDKNIKERKILEFVLNTIKPNDAQIIRISNWGGLKNTCFAVLNKEGKELIIKEVKEVESK